MPSGLAISRFSISPRAVRRIAALFTCAAAISAIALSASAATFRAAAETKTLQLDRTFGENGYASLGDKTLVNTLDDVTRVIESNVIAFGPHGKFAVIGKRNLRVITVTVFDRSGDRSRKFGRNGVFAMPVTRGSKISPKAAAFDQQGRIVLLTTAFKTKGIYGLRLLRITTKGRVDRTFGGDGPVWLDYDPISHAEINNSESASVNVTRSGGIRVFETGAPDALIWAVRPNGEFDREFGKRGRVAIPDCWIGFAEDPSNDLATWTDDGGAVVARSCNSGPALARVNKDGSWSPTWATRSTFELLGSQDQFGRIVESHFDKVVNDEVFSRFLTDGTADTSFGEAGSLEAKKVFLPGQGSAAGYDCSWATGSRGESTVFAYDARLPLNGMWVVASKLDANGLVAVNTKPFRFKPDDKRLKITYATPGPYSSGAIYVVSELWGKHDVYGLPMISRIVIR